MVILTCGGVNALRADLNYNANQVIWSVENAADLNNTSRKAANSSDRK